MKTIIQIAAICLLLGMHTDVFAQNFIDKAVRKNIQRVEPPKNPSINWGKIRVEPMPLTKEHLDSLRKKRELREQRIKERLDSLRNKSKLREQRLKERLDSLRNK